MNQVSVSLCHSSEWWPVAPLRHTSTQAQMPYQQHGWFFLKLVPPQQWACYPWAGLSLQLPNASSFQNRASLPWNPEWDNEIAFPTFVSFLLRTKAPPKLSLPWILDDGMWAERGFGKEDVERASRAAMAPFPLCHTGLEVTRWEFEFTSQAQILSLR